MEKRPIEDILEEISDILDNRLRGIEYQLFQIMESLECEDCDEYDEEGEENPYPYEKETIEEHIKKLNKILKEVYGKK